MLLFTTSRFHVVVYYFMISSALCDKPALKNTRFCFWLGEVCRTYVLVLG